MVEVEAEAAQESGPLACDRMLLLVAIASDATISHSLRPLATLYDDDTTLRRTASRSTLVDMGLK